MPLQCLLPPSPVRAVPVTSPKCPAGNRSGRWPSAPKSPSIDALGRTDSPEVTSATALRTRILLRLQQQQDVPRYRGRAGLLDRARADALPFPIAAADTRGSGARPVRRAAATPRSVRHPRALVGRVSLQDL